MNLFSICIRPPCVCALMHYNGRERRERWQMVDGCCLTLLCLLVQRLTTADYDSWFPSTEQLTQCPQIRNANRNVMITHMPMWFKSSCWFRRRYLHVNEVFLHLRCVSNASRSVCEFIGFWGMDTQLRKPPQVVATKRMNYAKVQFQFSNWQRTMHLGSHGSYVFFVHFDNVEGSINDTTMAWTRNLFVQHCAVQIDNFLVWLAFVSPTSEWQTKSFATFRRVSYVSSCVTMQLLDHGMKCEKIRLKWMKGEVVIEFVSNDVTQIKIDD